MKDYIKKFIQWVTLYAIDCPNIPETHYITNFELLELSKIELTIPENDFGGENIEPKGFSQRHSS